jgi:hypothetical protein
MMRRFAARVVVGLALLAAAPAFVAAQPAAPAPLFTPEQLMADVTTLAAPAMEGRGTGTPGNAKAREWILAQFKSAGLAPLGSAYQLPFSVQRRQQGGSAAPAEGINLAGLCRGTGAKDHDIIVISAHYDHLGVRDGAIYHGADDNASGVAVLVALARQCAKTPWMHDALFVSFDAEELGLQGARAFVAQPPVAKERMAINVNLDMVARGDRGELFVAGTSHSPRLRTVVQPVAERSSIKVVFGHDSGGGQDDWTTQSDHGAFHSAGIPFLYFGVEDHPDYHKPTDTADKINRGFFVDVAETVLDAVLQLDAARR